jgi:hypothetical protein
MRRLRVRSALAALVTVAAVGIVVPAQADAFVSYYNCVNKASGAWCDGRANGSYDGEHSWDYNQGWNPGGGTFQVCQRVYKPSSGGTLTGEGCGSNWTAHVYGNVQCVCYDAEVRQLSGSPASVNGFADADL